MENETLLRQFAVPPHIIDAMIESMGHLNEHWAWEDHPALGPVVTDLETDEITSGMIRVYCAAHHHQ